MTIPASRPLLTSLIYTSDALAPFEVTSLDRLAERAAVWNERYDITGYLSYRSPRFTQYLEGPDDVIAELVSKLRSDERHVVRTIAWLGDTERRFADWSMRLLDPMWLPTSNILEAIDELLMSVGPGDISDPAIARNFAKLVEAI